MLCGCEVRGEREDHVVAFGWACGCPDSGKSSICLWTVYHISDMRTTLRTYRSPMDGESCPDTVIRTYTGALRVRFGDALSNLFSKHGKSVPINFGEKNWVPFLSLFFLFIHTKKNKSYLTFTNFIKKIEENLCVIFLCKSN